jgi:archaeal flagellar protein FlaJ
MKSSKSSPKRTIKSYFDEISSFDLFHQLIYMSATSSAGISRARVFLLARHLANPTSQYFKQIHQVAENLRYNYPDAVRLVGEQTGAEETKTFLLRLSDALRSGEPMTEFLTREAKVQGENYTNDYLRRLESLKKWTDAYASVAVSASLIVIINMVMTMIYSISPTMMMMMVFIAICSSFGVAWIVFRSGPSEEKNIPLQKGSSEERLSQKLLWICVPLAMLVVLILIYAKIPFGGILISAGIILLPVGIVAMIFDGKTDNRDAEISSFLRSLGGTATSRGTTIKDALINMKIDSFPHLYANIHVLQLRLKAFAEPRFCWTKLGEDSGSKLVNQTVSIFYETINLGGEAERAGLLTSDFALKISMLRKQRQGIAGTFSGLTITMHVVLTAVMIFLLTVLEQFVIRLQQAMAGLGENPSGSIARLGLGNMFSFNTAQIDYLSNITVGMILFLALVNSFAIVASEGSHFIKILFYLAVLLVATGVCYIVVPPMVRAIL